MLRKKMRLCDESGASMVEFAIVLPLLLLLIFGIVEFGLILYNQQIITNASREGARAGIVATNSEERVTQGKIEEIVENYCNGTVITFGERADPVCPVTYPYGFATNASFGEDLTVRVGFVYKFLVLPPFMESSSTTLDLEAQTTMKYE